MATTDNFSHTYLLLDPETAPGEGYDCEAFPAAGLLKARTLLPLLKVTMHASFMKVKQLQMRLSQITTDPSVISGEELTVTEQV